MSGRILSILPEPFADFGVVAGGAAGGEGDWLGGVSVLELGAMSVLDEFLAFGTVPEVEAVGDDQVVLGLDDWADEVDDEGRFALAEVLALSGLTVVEGAGGGVGVLVGTLSFGAFAWRVGCGCG
jgi:hypothetical protein